MTDAGAGPPDADDAAAATAAAEAATFSPEGRGVGRATALMSVGTGLSRLTGVVRIFALAYAVGAVALADSYNLANTMPNIVQDVVLGGIVSATFVPVFVERLTTRPEREAWDAISAIVSVSLVMMAVSSLAFLLLAPWIIDVTTALNQSAGAAQSRHLSTLLLLLFVPQLTCYGFISVATALLNSRRRFGAPMFAPIANNVVLIVILLLFGTVARQATVRSVDDSRNLILLLGLGTTAGVVVQAGCLMPSLRRAGLRLTWRPRLRDEAVRTIARLSSWTFGLVVANQVALLVVLVLSERVGNGAVSAYTYAYIFFQLPYGVAAVSIMSATAPELTTYWAVGDMTAFRRRMGKGLRTMLAVIIPAAAGELVLARPLVELVLGHGASAGHTAQTSQFLAILALGLPGFCLFLYAIRVLQSMQDLRSAFWLYVLENAINIVVALVLVLGVGTGVRGIALSITVAYSAAAVVALLQVRAKVGGLGGDIVSRSLGHVGLSTAALVLATVAGSNFTGSTTTPALLARVVVGVVAGSGAYLLTAGVLARTARRRGPPPRPAGPGFRPPGPGGPSPGVPGVSPGATNGVDSLLGPVAPPRPRRIGSGGNPHSGRAG